MKPQMVRGQFKGDVLRLAGYLPGNYDLSVFDMQGNRIANFTNVQGNEIHANLRHGTYLVRITQGGRTHGIFKATKR